MKEVIKFLVQLGELFEIAEQEDSIENELAIYSVAKLFLKAKKVSIQEVETVIQDAEQRRILEKNLSSLSLLITHIKWKEKTIKNLNKKVY